MHGPASDVFISYKAEDRKRLTPLVKALEDEGFLVVAIRPPTVPDGTARLRFAFCSAHTEAEVARLAQVVASRVKPTSGIGLCPQHS